MTASIDTDPAGVDDPSVGAPNDRVAFANDARSGVIMQTIAVCGLVVAVVAGVVGWRFLTTLDRNLEQSLIIGEDAAATLVDTIDVAEQVITDLDA